MEMTEESDLVMKDYVVVINLHVNDALHDMALSEAGGYVKSE